MENLRHYEKWKQEEIFGYMMLQYDLDDNNKGFRTTTDKECINIPFQIIEWFGGGTNKNKWIENDSEVEIIMTGNIIFDGIRHSYFSPNDNGYINYIRLNDLSECLLRLHELCKKYSNPTCYP